MKQFKGILAIGVALAILGGSVLTPAMAVADTLTPVINTPANGSTVIVNTPTSFTASATGGTAPYVFSWNFGDGTTAFGSPFSKTYTTTGQETVTLVVTDFAGDHATTTINLTVNPAPTALSVNITNPANGANLATSTPTTFTASATGGTAPYAFSWNFGDGTNGSGASFSKTYTATGTPTVTVTATDFAGATATASIMVNVTGTSTSATTTPLTITNIHITGITQTSAIIHWTTNRVADSRVIYDTVSHPDISTSTPPNFGYASSTPTSDSSPKVMEHAVSVSGLTANTTYFFRVISQE